jgi:hypothetical protein
MQRPVRKGFKIVEIEGDRSLLPPGVKGQDREATQGNNIKGESLHIKRCVGQDSWDCEQWREREFGNFGVCVSDEAESGQGCQRYEFVYGRVDREVEGEFSEGFSDEC